MVDARICSWDSDPHPTFNLWTTGNVEEILVGHPLPLVCDMFLHADYESWREFGERTTLLDLLDLREPPVANWLGLFGGRYALNLAVFNVVFAAIQTGDGGSAALDQYFTTDEDITSGAAADPERAAATRHYLEFEEWPRAVERLDAYNAETAAARRRLALEDLTRRSDTWLWAEVGRLWSRANAILANHLVISGAAGECLGTVGKLLAAELGDAFDEASLSGLTSGLGQVESAEPAREIWRLGRLVHDDAELAPALATMSVEQVAAALAAPPSAGWRRLAAGVEAFIERYGFRGQAEADPSAPDWSEEPAYVLSMIKNDAAAPDSDGAEALLERAGARREGFQRELADQLPAAAHDEFHRLTEAAQTYARGREKSKACWVRSMRVARPLLLELAGRFAARGHVPRRDDFWYLRWDEVGLAVRGEGRDWSDVVRERTAERQRMLALDVPDMFAAPPEVGEAAAPAPSDGALQGAAVSGGRATGPARVIRSAAQPVELAAGDVLVAPFTDAAWTPMFVPAAAVVVETGGALSHAATVAREYGIPAVVVAGATALIADGQAITVDGDTGTVTIGG